MRDYIAILHKDETTDYGACFPDFPGCVASGRTTYEAEQMAIEALEFHIESMLSEGLVIPEPSPLSIITASELYVGAIGTFVVSVNIKVARLTKRNTHPPNQSYLLPLLLI